MTEPEYRELCELVRELDLAVLMAREAGPEVPDRAAGARFYGALQSLRTFAARFEGEHPGVYAEAYLNCEHAASQFH